MRSRANLCCSTTFTSRARSAADGHEWTMGAYATDFVERLWPLGYRGDRRVPYPAEGAHDEAARPAGGYLWDKAAAKGVSYRSYGEFVEERPRRRTTPATPASQGARGAHRPDVSQLRHGLSRRQASRTLPRGARRIREGRRDATAFHRPATERPHVGDIAGRWTVTACVGDNDLALGQLVEGLSKSRFWKQMAIFVVEDDAQNGSDHVDAHRTVALAISPYIKRHSVDSTLYSTSSMLRTMELILGLEPMSQFDAAARPMFKAFTATPDFSPYVHRPAGVDLKARNTRNAPLAAVSAKLDLEVEDRADDLLFNEIIWKAVKGADAIMPPPVRAAFVIRQALTKRLDSFLPQDVPAIRPRVGSVTTNSDEWIGQEIAQGRYRILGRIGHGSMGRCLSRLGSPARDRRRGQVPDRGREDVGRGRLSRAVRTRDPLADPAVSSPRRQRP